MITDPNSNLWSPLAQTLAPIFLDAGVKSALLLAVACLAVSGMKRCSASARHLVWFLAVASLLALPALSWSLPGWRVLPQWMSLPQNLTAAKLLNPPISHIAEPSFAVPPRHETPVLRTHENSADVSAFQENATTPARAPLVQTRPIPELKASSPAFSRRQWGLMAWLAGAVIALAPTLIGMLSLWRLGHISRRETGAAWIELLRRLLDCLSFRRRVSLLKSEHRRMPMTWGVLRPKLLLPEESQEWPDERRRVVLLHELAHAKRWDYLTNLVTQLVCALYWFNPLVWLAARQMVAERERACDDIVLRHGAKPADYAEQVLEIAAGFRLSRMAALGGIAMARPSKLEGRLRAILDGKRNRAALTRMAVIGALALLAIVVVPVSMMKAASGESKNQTAVGSTGTNSPLETPAQSPKSEAGTANSSQSLVTSAATAWGEAVKGFQVRLHALDAVEPGDTTPRLLADIANQGPWQFVSTTNSYCWQLEVDGRWYIAARSGALLEVVSGQPWTNLPVVLNSFAWRKDHWRTAHSNELGTSVFGEGYGIPHDFRPEALKMLPGKHRVRLAVVGDSKFAGGHGPVRAISEPVEIEVSAQSDSGGSRRSETPSPSPKSEVRSANSSQSLVTSAATAWGEPVKGFQVRLRVAEGVERDDGLPRLLVDIANLSRWERHVSTNDLGWQLEVDGCWYVGRRSLIAWIFAIKPNGTWTNVPVELNEPAEVVVTILSGRTNIAALTNSGFSLTNFGWRTASSSELVHSVLNWNTTPTSLAHPEPLNLSPGKHIVRFAVVGEVFPMEFRNETARAISNPVEIEVRTNASGGDRSWSQTNTAPPGSWIEKVHDRSGNVLLNDGSGVSGAVNRLQGIVVSGTNALPQTNGIAAPPR